MPIHTPPATMSLRTRPGAPPRAGSLRATSVFTSAKHSRHRHPYHRFRERFARVRHPRPRPGVAPRPTRRVRAWWPRASAPSTVTSSASTCSNGATTSRSTSSRWCCAARGDRPAGAGDRGGRRRQRRGGAHHRPLPRPAPRRAGAGDHALRVRQRRAAAPDPGRRTRDEFLADWSALLVDGAVLASAGTATPDASVLGALVAGTAASPMVADGTTGPDDLAVASLPKHDAALLVGRDGRAVPPPRAASWSRSPASPTAPGPSSTDLESTCVKRHVEVPV